MVTVEWIGEISILDNDNQTINMLEGNPNPRQGARAKIDLGCMSGCNGHP
jgi:hypothetical protein